jgi:hypothetical protein
VDQLTFWKTIIAPIMPLWQDRPLYPIARLVGRIQAAKWPVDRAAIRHHATQNSRSSAFARCLHFLHYLQMTDPQLKLLTGSEAVELFGISQRTIGYAKVALRHGSPALRAALESGSISVWGAAWLADHRDAKVQDWVVAKPNRFNIRQRLRMARRDADAVAQLAKRD